MHLWWHPISLLILHDDRLCSTMTSQYYINENQSRQWYTFWSISIDHQLVSRIDRSIGLNYSSLIFMHCMTTRYRSAWWIFNAMTYVGVTATKQRLPWHPVRQRSSWAVHAIESSLEIQVQHRTARTDPEWKYTQHGIFNFEIAHPRIFVLV